MWFERKFYRYCTALILLLLIIFLAGKINYFFEPIKIFVTTLFYPILISGFLYYLFRPIVNLIVKARIPRVLAIIIVFIVVLGLFYFGSKYAGGLLVRQTNEFIKSIPSVVEDAFNVTMKYLNKQDISMLPIEQIKNQLSTAMGNILSSITQGVFSGIAAIAGFASILLLVPLILFYMLKDENLFSQKLKELLPKKYKGQTLQIFDDADKTLSSYITAQAIIALVDGILMLIGYLIFGLKYSLILSLFVAISAFIPVIGAPLGVIPALLVGIGTNGIFMGVKIVALAIIVQQLEGNLISPQLMGKRMKIHPLTFIFVLLIAASLFGFVGMLVAIPFYAVSKVVIIGIYRLIKCSNWKCPLP